MGLIESIKEMLEPDTEETVLYELSCEDCGATFMTHSPPEEATCEECGSEDLVEESRMYAGGEAPAGA